MFKQFWERFDFLDKVLDYLIEHKEKSDYNLLIKMFTDAGLVGEDAEAILAEINDFAIHSDYKVLIDDLMVDRDVMLECCD